MSVAIPHWRALAQRHSFPAIPSVDVSLAEIMHSRAPLSRLQSVSVCVCVRERKRERECVCVYVVLSDRLCKHCWPLIYVVLSSQVCVNRFWCVCVFARPRPPLCVSL